MKETRPRRIGEPILSLVLGALIVLSCLNVAMAETDYYLFMGKYGIVYPKNLAHELLIRANMFRDPDAMRGKRVFIEGLLHDTEKVDAHRTIYYLTMRVPFTENPTRWEKIAFLSKVDYRHQGVFICMGEVLGSVRNKDIISGSIRSIPKVREIECVRGQANTP